jgi:hypothetical protein
MASIMTAEARLGAVCAPQNRATSWLHSPAWDGLWMQSALWLTPLALWLASRGAGQGAGPLDALYFAITALFWIGHRLGSAWLAYATEAYRPLLRAEPVRFLLLPLLVTAACFAILLPPDSALPFTRMQRFIGLAILDYAASTYHFGAQHFGALSLYRARAGRSACPRTRRHDRLFALGVGGVLVFVADALAGTAAYQNLWLPAGSASLVAPLRHGALLLLCGATGVMLWAEFRQPERSLPRLLYIFGLAAMVAVALQPRSLFAFLVIWTSQHWILACGLTSRTPRQEPAPGGGPLRRALHALNTRGWALALLVMLISLLLLPIFEVEANWPDGGTYYGDRLFGHFAAALRTSSFVPALLALGLASGFVHYLLDRGVYRLSDPKVRIAARGLLSA